MSLVLTIEGTDRTTLLAAGTLNFNRVANYDDRLTCTLRTESNVFMPKIGQDIQIHDGTEFIWGGIIGNLRIVKIEPGLGAGRLLEIDLNGQPYKTIATRRTPLLSYDQKSAGYIANQVVTLLLAGEGVTAGTINTGADPMGEFGEYDTLGKNCYEIMDDLANASGYQWYIGPDKKLHFFNFDLVINCTKSLRETTVFTDFQLEDYTESLDQYANKVFVYGGADEGSGYTSYGMAEDTNEQAARAAIEGGTGVHGVVIRDPNINSNLDAQALAEAELLKKKVIPGEITFTTFTLTAWYPRFKLTVNLPSLGMTTDQVYSVDSMEFFDLDGKTLQCRVRALRRSDAEFSSSPPQTGIEYLSKLVSASNAVSGKVTVNSMVTTLSQIIQTATDRNSAQIVVPAATETEIARCLADIVVAPGLSNTAVIVSGMINGVTSQDAKVTVRMYRDNEALTPVFQKVLYGLETEGLTFTTCVPSPAGTSMPWIVKVTVDQGTFTVDAMNGVMWVLAVGVGVGEVVDYQPRIDLSLTIPDMPDVLVPTASVVYVDPVTIDSTLTVPDMPITTETAVL